MNMKKLLLSAVLCVVTGIATLASVSYAGHDFINSQDASSLTKEASEETEAFQTISVEVRVAGTLGNELLKKVSQWSYVKELIVTGELNQSDMKIFSRLTELIKLDLSGTNITTIGGCNGLIKLSQVILPSTVTIVESYAFTGCCSLTSVNLPNAIILEESSFEGCISLTSIDIPKVEEIGYSTFENCVKLSKIYLANVKVLENYSFKCCSSLNEVKIPEGITEIPYECFFSCSSLKNVSFPSTLKSIETNAFVNTALTELLLPEGLVYIRDCAFAFSDLKKISIPASIQSIGEYAFYCILGKDIYTNDIDFLEELLYDKGDLPIVETTITTVYCNAIMPIKTDVFKSLIFSSTSLYVPAFSLTSYRLSDSWYKFTETLPLENEIKDLNINQDYTISDYTGLADKINLSLSISDSDYDKPLSVGHLTVNAGTQLNVSKFSQDQNNEFNYRYDYETGDYIYSYLKSTTLIAENEITADTVEMGLRVEKDKWNFISFPFDVKVSDIKMPEGTLWVIRKYSGEDRANMTGYTWQNMTNGMILNAYEGYILHCNNDEVEEVLMKIRAIDNGNKNNVFKHENVTIALKEYLSEFAHNSSWNLVGNPYPCFLNIKSMDVNSPITVYNGDGYTAYSVLDDDYVLHPNEAFFVQRPIDGAGIVFNKEGRSHEYNMNESGYSMSNSKIKSVTEERSVLNFMLSGNGYTDKARIVMNELAKTEYEMNRDAGKFMSSNSEVPQIYVNAGGLHYAIDERPVGNGEYTLGVHTGKEGTYKLHLSVKNFEGKVYVTDVETGITTELTESDYTFEAGIGVNNSRFVVRVAKDMSGLNSIEKAVHESGNIYNIKGQQVGEDAKGLLIINGKKVIK